VVQQGERKDEADLKCVLQNALVDRSHLQILEKMPSLTEKGQLAIRYKIQENANRLLASICEVCGAF
jgi:hypothetical protein